MAHLRALSSEYEIARIVVGRPLALSGREGDASRRATELARMIADALGVPVEMWDERLSSVEAERVLAGSRAKKGAVDRVAAVLILQGYLDHQRRPEASP